jgi:hypothetical protein
MATLSTSRSSTLYSVEVEKTHSLNIIHKDNYLDLLGSIRWLYSELRQLATGNTSMPIYKGEIYVSYCVSSHTKIITMRIFSYISFNMKIRKKGMNVFIK